MARNDKNITIGDAQIAFRNFAGKEDTYNRAGDRNFAILLDDDLALTMIAAGWNVKHLKVREEGDAPQAYIQCALSYKNRPPKVVLVTSRGMTYLSEEDVETLDWVDIAEADVTLNPYEWTVNGNAGVKAYVHTLIIRIVEDYLVDKWTAWVEQQNRPRAIEGASDYIDGDAWVTAEIEGTQ